MPDYRLYSLDGTKRISSAAELISAPSDAEAIARAQALKTHRQCELWQGKRLVAAIPAAK